MRLTTSQLALGLASFSAHTAFAQSTTVSGVEEPSAAPTLGAQVVQGCFGSVGQLTPINNTITFNSKSACAHDVCFVQGYKVAATLAGNQCFCGNKYPPKSSVVADSQCNVMCPGYGLQACGGISSYTVYNTGLILNVDYSSDADASSAISATASSTTTRSAATAATTVINGGQTTVVYITASATSDSSASSPSSSSGPSVGGIAAGVVCGVLAMAAIGAGLIFYMRARRNREIEAEHRRSAAVNAFMANGGKPPGSSGGFSVDTDSRLDPVMAQRRMSSGSIADNQDYSRRILRVTNA